MADRALIHKIIPFSCVDGPGNRMVIFLQGCNFKCTYCHNPETIAVCNHCGICVTVCPTGALKLEGEKVLWEEGRCIECDACIRTCPNLSTPKAKIYSVEDLMKVIKKASPFIQGITVSGGECTLQSEFLIALFKRVKSELNLTCLIDTNGSVDFEVYPELVDQTDGFMLDVKSVDPKEHFSFTGMNNSLVLKNLSWLLEIGKLIEVRTVISMDLNNEKTVKEVAKIIEGRCPYKLLPYRNHGVRPEGIERHGMDSPSEDYMNSLKKLI